jgi:hypothetical protein
MNAARSSLFLLLHACTAPELAPPAELAGSLPVGTSGTPVETLDTPPPFPAWTTATPLTLVAPGGANVGVLERVGVRVKVLQIRAGRIHVLCTGCEGLSEGGEGYLPRDVLWAAPVAAAEAPSSGDDPLSLLLAHRARWAVGLDLPEGGTASAMCWLVDQGLTVEGSRAASERGGGSLVLQRTGAIWRLTEAAPPSTAPEGWRCSPG